MEHLTEEQQQAALLSASSDLKWLLADHRVSEEVQVVLYHYNFSTLPMFQGLGDTRTEVKETLKNQFQLDATASLADRQQVAAIQAAWDAAAVYIAKEAAARAEAKTSHFPRPVCITEQQAMKAAHELNVGSKLPRRLIPSKAYLGLKSEDVENNELTAETLAQVTSKNDVEEDGVTPGLDDSGRFILRRSAKKGTAPVTTEELREKLTVMGNCWLFLKTKHSNRPWLKDLTHDTFRDYADYLLGARVYNMRSNKGGKRVGPTWAMLLEYDYEMRKEVCDLVLAGETMAQAFANVVKNAEIKNAFIVEPMVLPPDTDYNRSGDPYEQQVADHMGKGKGKGRKRGARGKGKGKGKGSAEIGNGLKVRMGDKPICFAFNNEGENCAGDCGMAHVCQFCLSADHPKYKCPKMKRQRK